MLAAKDYFKTHSVVKVLGSGSKKLESVAFNRNHFESFARELLTIRHCCVEVYSGSKGDWTLSHQASPGNLIQVCHSTIRIPQFH